MKRTPRTDQEVVEKARRAVVVKEKFRWFLLIYAAIFLGLSGYCTVLTIRKIENLIDAEQMKMGFVYGMVLASIWASFGLLGALCLGKFLVGMNSDVQVEALLVSYHDRLRDLGKLPEEQNDPPARPGNGNQPIRAERN